MSPRLVLWGALTLAFVPSMFAFAEAPVGAITGQYAAEDGSHGIALTLEGGELRGRIVWTRPRGIRDENNPDPALRGRRVAGIEHLRGLYPDGHGAWQGGVLYNPEDGKTYDASLELEGTRLEVRGRPRIAVLGRLLGALFGRIHYVREPAHVPPER